MEDIRGYVPSIKQTVEALEQQEEILQKICKVVMVYQLFGEEDDLRPLRDALCRVEQRLKEAGLLLKGD